MALPAQIPDVIGSPSGSSAVNLATTPVPFSAYSSGASPSKSGISSTLVTLMVTVMVELSLSESVAVTVTV